MSRDTPTPEISATDVEKFIQSVKDDYEFMDAKTKEECKIFVYWTQMMIAEIAHRKGSTSSMKFWEGRV